MASKDLNPQKDEFRTCPNCYYPLPRFGQFCSHCGQKYTDGKVTLWELIQQFFSDTLNLDAKIWRTLLALFVPGKLTVAFFQGRQQQYVRPLRLFFVFAILTIAAISYFETDTAQEVFLNINDDFGSDKNYQEFLVQLDTTTLHLKQKLPATTHAGLDSLQIRMQKNVVDSLSVGMRIDWNTEEKLSLYKVATLDLINLSQDSLFQRYEVHTFWDKLLLRQNIRLREKGDNIGDYILGQTVWMLLLLMPILALFLKLLYIRRSFYYVEHLIFSFHVHAFIFLLLTLTLLLENLAGPGQQVDELFFGDFLIGETYFYLAMRRFYRQSFGKTFIKFLLLNLFYIIIFVLALIMTIVISALVY